MSKRKPPIGSRWRILAHSLRGTQFDIRSSDYPNSANRSVDIPVRTIFDELVIDGWLHIEQMDRDTWLICIGDENRMVRIGRDGKVTVGEMYK